MTDKTMPNAIQGEVELHAQTLSPKASDNDNTAGYSVGMDNLICGLQDDFGQLMPERVSALSPEELAVVIRWGPWPVAVLSAASDRLRNHRDVPHL